MDPIYFILGLLCGYYSDDESCRLEEPVNNHNLEYAQELPQSYPFTFELNSRSAYTSDLYNVTEQICGVVEMGVSSLLSEGLDSSSEEIIQSFSDKFQVPYLTASVAAMKPDYPYGKWTLNMIPQLSKPTVAALNKRRLNKITYITDSDDGMSLLKEILRDEDLAAVTIATHQVSTYYRQSHEDTLVQMRELGDTNIWIYATVEGTLSFLKEAQRLQMLTTSYDYTILNPATARYSGVLRNFVRGGASFTLFNLQPISSQQKPSNDTYDELPTLISFDSVAVLRSAWAETLNQTSGSSLTPENLKHNCSGLEPRGPETKKVMEKFMEALKQTRISGMTGNIQFDSRGLRKNLSLEIHKLLSSGEMKQEPPFLMLRNNGDPSLTGNSRFEGYSVDLAYTLSYYLRFTFEIRLVADSRYGGKIPGTNTWNGMVGEVIRKEADLAIAALTITADRQRDIAFSKPFMNTGISIMVKKPQKQLPGHFSFLEPFSYNVWFLIIIAYCTVSLFLFIEARLSASEWQDKILTDGDSDQNPTEKLKHNSFNFGNSLWFSLVALLQQGTNFAPKGIFVSNKYRSPASRLVGTAWWLFTIIITSHYIAYLARFINVERLVIPITNADDLVAHNQVHYGTTMGGSTYQFFRNSQIEVFRRMWDAMNSFTPSAFVSRNSEGIQRVRESNGKYAFLIESNMNDYISQQKPCDTMKVGPNLDYRGYGIAAALDSPWIKNISLLLTRLEEDGTMERLKTTWWIDKGECGGSFSTEPMESGINSVGLDSLAGVFYIFLCGLGLALVLSVLQFLIKCFIRCCTRTRTSHQAVRRGDLAVINAKEANDTQAEPPKYESEKAPASGKGKKSHKQETAKLDVAESTA